MTDLQYLDSILVKYSPHPQPAIVARDLVPHLNQWAGQWLAAPVSYSGSFAKGTAIAGGSDIDLFVSLKSRTPGTLKQIYDSLHTLVGRLGLSGRKQNVSIAVQYRGVNIDLVPGRRQSPLTNYHSLHRHKTDSWTQTNVAVQVKRIQNSRRQNEIRLTKIWRNLHGLEFPSVLLEMAVVNALFLRRTDTLVDNMRRVLIYLRDSFPTRRIIDPGNTNNILSDELTIAEKQSIASAARRTYQGAWNQFVW